MTTMKKLGQLGGQEISILRDKAQSLIDYEENNNSLCPDASSLGTNRSNVQHVLPLYLTMFVFETFCQPGKLS